MSRKGGYLVIDLKNKNLNSSPVIEGIYDLIEGNYGKSILLSGITISNVEKADVFTKPDVSSSTFVFKNVYGYDISVNDEDQVSIASTEVATRAYVDNKIDDKIDALLEGDRIDDKIESLVEGGTLDNAKPIYCHPLTLFKHSGDEQYKFSMLIFNNSEELIDTGLKLKNLLLSFNGRVLISGSIKTATYYMAPAFILSGATNLYLCGIDSTGVSHDDDNNPINLITLISDDQVISDVVNKIN